MILARARAGKRLIRVKTSEKHKTIDVKEENSKISSWCNFSVN